MKANRSPVASEKLVSLLSIRLKTLQIIASALLLSACSNTAVVSRSSTPAYVQRIREAQVVWKDNVSLPNKILKEGAAYVPATINEVDKIRAHNATIQVINLFRRAAPELLQEKLQARGVVKGDEVIIELFPIEASVVVGDSRVPPYGPIAGRGIHVRMAIKLKTTGAEVWSVTIRDYAMPSQADQLLVDRVLTRVAAELKGAGWLG